MNIDDSITWARYGGYEVSSAGDKRFSPLWATMPDGRTIEEHYQCDVKGYNIGGTDWRRYKSCKPLIKLTKQETFIAYRNLWEVWASNNVDLIIELKAIAVDYNNSLTDRFSSDEVNQANALADIINRYY